MPQKSLLQSAGDGTAVPTGYVGEVLSVNTAALTGLPINPTSFSPVLTLNRGLYLLILTANHESTTPTSLNLGLTDGSNTTITFDSFNSLIATAITNNNAVAAGASIKTTCIMRVTTDGTQYKARFVTFAPAGSQHILSIQAVRIA